MILHSERAAKMLRERRIKEHKEIGKLVERTPANIISSNSMNETLWEQFRSYIYFPTPKTLRTNFFSTDNEDPNEFIKHLNKIFQESQDRLFSSSIYDDIMKMKRHLIKAIYLLNAKLPIIFNKWKDEDIQKDMICNDLLMYFSHEALNLWTAPSVLDSGHRKKDPNIQINVNPIVALKKKRKEIISKLGELKPLLTPGSDKYNLLLSKVIRELQQDNSLLTKQIEEQRDAKYMKRPSWHQGNSSINFMLACIYALFPPKRREALLPDLAEIHAYITGKQPDKSNLELVKKRVNNYPKTKMGIFYGKQLERKYKVKIISNEQFWNILQKSILTPMKDGKYTITIEKTSDDKTFVIDDLKTSETLVDIPVQFEPKEVLPPDK